MSTGDIDGDGREDAFIGGAFGQSGKVFLQQPDGRFTGKDRRSAQVIGIGVGGAHLVDPVESLAKTEVLGPAEISCLYQDKIGRQIDSPVEHCSVIHEHAGNTIFFRQVSCQQQIGIVRRPDVAGYIDPPVEQT